LACNRVMWLKSSVKLVVVLYYEDLLKKIVICDFVMCLKSHTTTIWIVEFVWSCHLL
jgi:hypothetical protein